MPNHRPYLSRPKAAQYLGLTPKRFAAIAHLLPVVNIGKRVYYTPQDLDAFRATFKKMPGEKVVLPRPRVKKPTGLIDRSECGYGFFEEVPDA